MISAFSNKEEHKGRGSMAKRKLDGIFVPHITPFKRDGSLDEKALRTCVRFWLEGGVSGLVSCGSNGEAPYLSREERKKVIETVMDEVSEKTIVIAGTGSISTRETILFTKDAKDAGVDAALVVTPFYFKLSNKEVLKHYEALLNAVDLPIILYSVPKFTGYTLEPNLIQQLASEHENVIGVKDSSGNFGAITETIRLVGNKISVLAGTAEVTLPTLIVGGSGGVIAVANVFPRLCNELYGSFKRGNYEKAGKLQRQISHINEILVKKYNQLSSIKEALNILGLPAGYPRMPSLPLDKENRKEIEALVKNLSTLPLHGKN
jgi:4-hydroxy-tetrahydrodipicolinate synthase